ncbi:hypothetical protein BYT27DRAFT_7219538 [Phlegmacium glaucopus]|nr:hypothetical protein BYT27DRAFT_7219538 [Phlegmacium glaucopus]
MSPPPGVFHRGSQSFSIEPQGSPKPQPIGSLPFIVLLTTCTLCGLFLLWRKVDVLSKAVSHKLKTFRSNEGRIRLSEDDGPPANEFLADDYDEDNEHLPDSDNEPLSEHIRKVTEAWRRPDSDNGPSAPVLQNSHQA